MTLVLIVVSRPDNGGAHYRLAALREVGVYLLLPHRNTSTLCVNLSWQKETLEKFQKSKDQQSVPSTPIIPSTSAQLGPDATFEQDEQDDAAAMRLLDQLLAGDNPDTILEYDDQEDILSSEADIQNAEAGASGFGDFTMLADPGPDHDMPQTQRPDISRQDGLNNPYVHVVHSNGIHCMSLVYCSCHNNNEIFTDLIHAGMVPTSMSKIRTLFTTIVLDRFQTCNLEMKSSAYQFYQMLRRITNPMNPFQEANLYHELRRLSRLWRWVKKLRWAGYGQRTGQQSQPEPGGLGNFCPACPQIGVNVPDGWTDDPERWVYRRVLTADGNFKADHVRQKGTADDLWLYDGLGMTARRTEYKRFLESAAERKTVSVVSPSLVPMSL